MVEIRIGSPDGEHVSLEIVRRCHPEMTGYWDGNWLAARFHIRAGRWTGEWNDATVRAEELARFRDAVALLQNRTEGKAVFETLEGWLSLRLAMDRLGHLAVSGEACDVVGIGNVIQFILPEFDQTYLPELSGQLEAAVEAFRVRGTP